MEPNLIRRYRRDLLHGCFVTETALSEVSAGQEKTERPAKKRGTRRRLGERGTRRWFIRIDFSANMVLERTRREKASMELELTKAGWQD